MNPLSDCKNYEYPSSSSACVIASNVDMLTLIVLRLPLTSLLVFKSVSKQWYSLISDPFFINKYNLQNSPLLIEGLYAQTVPYCLGVASPDLAYVALDGLSCCGPFRTLSFIDDPFGIKIVQSCNGLMLCRSSCNSYDHRNEYPTYYVCNPSTRQYRPIVCESEKHKKGFEKLSSVSLAYDAHKSPHYRVVCIWLASSDEDSLKFDYQMEIYSSETVSWKQSGEISRGPYNDHSGVFWNGSLHWIDKYRGQNLYYFNDDMDVKYFGESKGHLYMIRGEVNSPTSFEIFDMKTDYTHWNKKYRVSLKELKRAYPWFKFDVFVVNEVEGVSPCFVLRIQDRVISFDIQDGSFREFQLLAPESGIVEFALDRCASYIISYYRICCVHIRVYTGGYFLYGSQAFWG